MKKGKIIIKNDAVHARPATKIVQISKKFESEITLKKGEREINTRSMVAIIGMGMVKDDCVELGVSGPDEEEAYNEMEALLKSGCGDL